MRTFTITTFLISTTLSMHHVTAHTDCVADVIRNTHSRLQKRGEEYKYGYENDKNPSYWGNVHSTCNQGKQQSPVNFPDSSWLKDRVKMGPAIKWGIYQNVNLSLEEDGLEVQLGEKYNNGSNRPTTMTFPYNPDETYELQQFHFHISSEHHVQDKVYPMEVHFVFKSLKDNFAVVGFFFDFAPTGQRGKFLRHLMETSPKNTSTGFTKLPSTPGDKVTLKNLDLGILKDAYDQSPSSYRYNGSLTTPPCTEGIQWTVVQNPLRGSAQQLGSFYHSMPFNARFTQPLFSRS